MHTRLEFICWILFQISWDSNHKSFLIKNQKIFLAPSALVFASIIFLRWFISLCCAAVSIFLSIQTRLEYMLKLVSDFLRLKSDRKSFLIKNPRFFLSPWRSLLLLYIFLLLYLYIFTHCRMGCAKVDLGPFLVFSFLSALQVFC